MVLTWCVHQMGSEGAVEDGLRRKFARLVERMERVQKEDLDLPNHLSGLRRTYLKLHFRNVSDLEKVKRVLMPLALRNAEGHRDGSIPVGRAAGPPAEGRMRGAAPDGSAEFL
jgi:hypothetical protein